LGGVRCWPVRGKERRSQAAAAAAFASAASWGDQLSFLVRLPLGCWAWTILFHSSIPERCAGRPGRLACASFLGARTILDLSGQFIMPVECMEHVVDEQTSGRGCSQLFWSNDEGW
jgi:hypothetical protein